ncbi:hypothetical protein RJ639_035235 [Escallonia herrerae]|uniref:NAC domain-containing protein n=1 Tax=Escallonia herrerae TaxID=1293975 RepID=A0AA88WQR8_9ASTE|nr:hypothetical protein RJ639_035235 [Escallonia herrerae]
MAIAATMNQDDNSSSSNPHNKDDQHDHDMVMPGFRFHPTEEELVEFYLRRKVEGKRFNVELITFLDLYRYDPWELPALAAIGEKEWFFYVPRDRKYRNGDRPNRVTTSGYWKATGADRMIRTENFRSIGLKKTLVFYSGKAPKGIRTSWIMNEYRLPQHETERLQKAEISLCRVYKRAGVEDHPSLPRSLPTRASSSRDKKQNDAMHDKVTETSGSSSGADVGTSLGLSNHNSYIGLAPMSGGSPLAVPPPAAASLMEDDNRVLLLHQQRQVGSLLVPNCTTNSIFTGGSSSSSLVSPSSVDDLHRLINYQQASTNQNQLYHNHHFPSQFSSTTLSTPPAGSLQANFSDRLWDWNSITEATKDYTNPFK